MDDELIWKMQLRQAEHAIRELCRESVERGRFDRLRDVSLMLHEIEREALDDFQIEERGEKATRPFHPVFRPIARRLEALSCLRGFAWEWSASKIRTQLGRD